MHSAPLDVGFGSVITDIDLRAVVESPRPTLVEELHALWLEYALLIFPGQFLTRTEQDRFAQLFGDLEFTASPISNLTAEGTILSDLDDDVVKAIRANEGWHHDSTYMPIQAKGAVFTAEVVPTSGGATGFADMRAAYDALEPAQQTALADLRAYHSIYYSRERVGLLPTATDDQGRPKGYGYTVETPCLRPLVKVHPDTGRANLLIGQHAHDIEGMDRESSEALLDALNAAACADDRAYYHQWEVGDALMWDNRRLMHRATPYDKNEPRRMWHTRIAGSPATELALNHTL